MDDNDNKPPRSRKPGGQRSPGAGPSGPRKGGKPPFGGGKKQFGKPRAGEKAADRDFKRGRKPYKPREDRSGEPGDRSARPFRAERPFRGSEAGEGGSEQRPFRKPYQKRDGDDGRRPGPRPGRAERAARRPDEMSERPQRRPRAETGGKPFREDGPRDDRPRDGRSKDDRKWSDRKPFGRKAEGGGEDRRFPSGAPKRDRDSSPAGFKPRPRQVEAAPDDGERIAKRLARAGIASRRDAEELIAAGRVKVNRQVITSPALNVSAADIIHLDGMEIPPVERTRLFLFHKPAGVVTTNRDPEGRKTVFDLLPDDLPRLMTVGRLDINTEGLLLLTNDGGLSRVLELPATGWLRRYRARVHGKVDERALAGLREGIAVGGVFYGAVEASLERTQGTNAWLTIGLREGKNREVKNILGALGLDVTRLIRVSYGPFQLGELPEGHVLEIKGRTLRDQLGERLVEESGANFEADVLKPFSNKPVRRTEPRAEQPERVRHARDGIRAPIGEGGLIKARKRRENSRDEALGKLSTRPERGGFGQKSGFGGKPARDFSDRPARGGKKFERDERPMDPPGQRRANVWMAPGARPQGDAKASDTASPRSRGEGKGEGKNPRRETKEQRRGANKEGSRRPSSAHRAPSPRSRGEGKPPKKR